MVKVRRMAAGTLVAVTLASVIVATTGWNPLCLLFEPWSAPWIAMGCFVDPPPPPSPEG